MKSGGPFLEVSIHEKNLILVDINIRRALHLEIQSCYTLENEIRNLSSTVYTTIAAMESSQRRIQKLYSMIQNIKNYSRVKGYMEETKEMIDEYITLCNIHINIVSLEDEENVLKRKETIYLRFLQIAMKYVDINMIGKINSDTNICSNCGEDLSFVETMSDGQQVCSCGLMRYKSRSDPVMGELPISQKDYSNKENFRKTIIRFMGAQTVTFDIESVCSRLNFYFMKVGLFPSSYYVGLPRDRYGKKQGTSLKLLLSGLKHIGETSLYGDANLIGRELWGWKLHDLSGIMDAMLEDYDKTQEIFSSMSEGERGRKSSISTQLRLFLHMRMRGVDNCRLEDFKIPKQNASLENQRIIWKRMCDGANDPNIFYIPF